MSSRALQAAGRAESAMSRAYHLTQALLAGGALAPTLGPDARAPYLRERIARVEARLTNYITALGQLEGKEAPTAK